MNKKANVDYTNHCPKCGSFAVKIEKYVRKGILCISQSCPSCDWGQSSFSMLKALKKVTSEAERSSSADSRG